MEIQQLNISIYKLALVTFILGLFHLDASAQSDALSIDELIAGNNSILLHDAQSFDHPAFSGVVPSNPEMELLGDGIAVNWTRLNILSTKSKLTLQLFTNEDIPQPSPVRAIQYLKIKVKFLKTNGDLDSLDNVHLQTGYDNSANSAYVFYHSLKQDSAVLAFIQVDSIVFEGRSYPPIGFSYGTTSREPVEVINSITPFKLVARLDPVHTYNLLSSDIPLNGSSISDCKVKCTYIDVTGDIRVDWSAAHRPPSTTYTELEWTFVNTYPDSLSNPNTPYDFRMNNTSVQISSPDHYSIPMIFEKGVLIFRIRWVSLRGDGHRPVYGTWSLPEYGVIRDVTCGKFEITNPLIHEGDKKNWQYIATYAEEGKHKAVVTYYDGTMRSRQAVTRLSQSNTVIVGETIYDFQGRPAIQVLPVPVSLKDFPLSDSPPTVVRDEETTMSERFGLLGSGSTTPTTPSAATEMVPDVPGQSMPQKIQYYQNFNLNTAGPAVPYSWMDFDTGSLCNTTVHALPMTNSKGASRYYSVNNDDKSGFNANIPDANGYPFVQTEYTPDNTGRISRQGSVGENFQLRRGHDTRYYNDAPTRFCETLQTLSPHSFSTSME